MRRTTQFLTALLVAITGFAFTATLRAQTISTYAGNGASGFSGTAGYTGDGGAATSAEINNLTGIVTDAAGNVYFTDNADNVVRKITASTGIISTYVGTGSAGYSGDGGSAAAATLNSPACLAMDGSGNLYIADYNNNVIRKVTPGGIISTYAGNYSAGAGYGGDGGEASSATLNQPFGVAVDGAGNLYIADQGNYRIRKVTSAGVISTLGGNGTAGYSGDGASALLGEFQTLGGIAADAGGNVYIADPNNGRIRKINISGVLSTFAGNGGTTYSGDGGSAVSASLYLPTNVSCDIAGNVFISDQFNNRIRKVTSGGVISTFAGNGTSGATGDGGSPTSAELALPSGTASDLAGNLYILDAFNYKIRKVTASCSGTPTAGAATSTASTVSSSGTSFVLSLTGASTSTGLTFQWQSSPTGATWTNITGATSYPYAVTESATTEYRCIVTCSGSSATSSAVTVSYTTGSYCTDGIGSPCAEGAGISEFHIVGISGTSIIDNASCVSTSAYQNMTSLSVTLRQGGSYTTTVGGVSPPSPGLGNQVWIDFNDDNVFEASETVGYGASYSPSISSEILSIPTWANIGTHRMRLVQVYNGADRYPPTYMMDPCTVSYSFGEVRDYTVVIAPLPPCSGTPVAGTAVASGGVACPSTSFTLSLSGATDTVSLLTYQWQSSPDGSTWTSITGAEYSTYTTTESASTYFRCLVTCSVGGSTSASTSTYVSYISACYCTPVAPSGYTGYSCTSGAGGAIAGVAINGYSGTSFSDAGACTSAGYEDRTAYSVSMEQSVSYVATVTLTTGSSLTMSGQVWIDYNDNGTFENTESVGGISSFTATGNITITPSPTATPGSHRMRIGVVYTSYATYPAINPCGGTTYYYEDYHDYTVVIVALPPCSGSPSAGTAIASTGTACPGTPFVLNLSSSTLASSLSYQWQSSSDGTTWTNISGATTLPFSTTQSAPTYYQCLVTCTVSSSSVASSSVYVGYIGACYCTPAFGAPCETLYNFSIASVHAYGYSGTSIIDNNACAGSGYEDLTAMSITYVQGQFYSDTITATTGTSGTYADNNQIWIDFNDNGTFESTESIAGANGYTTSVADTFTIPAGANTGSHRMRIVQVYTTYGSYPSIPACPTTSTYYGEARDYTAIIVSPTPTITASPSSKNFGSVTVGSCSTPTAFTLTGHFLTPASGTVTVTATAPYSVCATIGGTYVSSYTISYSGGAFSATMYAKFCPSSSGGSASSICISGGGTSSSTCIGVLGTGTGGACNVMSTFAGNGTAGYSGEGTATGVELNGPTNVAVDASGNVYISDASNNRIRKVTSGAMTTIVGNGTAGFTGDGGSAISAEINDPIGVVVDGSGNVYFCDYNNNRVRKVSSSGIITTLAGGASAGFSGDGGAATSATLNHPYAVALDASGNLYICDNGNSRVRKVNTSGIITTVAGTGSASYGGDGGAATAAAIGTPDGIAIDVAGNIYISDRSNEYIRKINASGIISTYAGTGTGGYTGDGGAATAAELFRPCALALDGLGNLYVADQDNDRVRKISNTGIISLVAGGSTGGFAGDGGAATAALLNYNGGVAVDAADNVYIADLNNNRIRKVTSGATSVPAISGLTTEIAGNTITMTDATSGGTWTSGNTAVATVSGGTVGGVAVGNTFITYSVTNSCGTTGQIKTDTVTSSTCTASPISGTISASLITACSLPFSSTITASGYTAAGPGISYQWQSSTDSSTWTNVTGATSTTYSATVSTASIYYRFVVTCSATGSANTAGVHLYKTNIPVVPAIGGATSVCTGNTAVVTDATAGGTWTSSSPSFATIDASGTVYGITVGTALISYTVTNMCGTTSASADIIVSTVTAVAAISGPSSVCVAHNITLADGSSGGTWGVVDGSVGGITSGGVFTGYSAGSGTDTTSVYYTLSGACGTSTAYYVITVEPLATAGFITGTLSACPGGSTTLTDTTHGGSWNSGNTAVATVNSSGVVFGVSGGSAPISYTVTNSCGTAVTFATVVINPLPSAGAISGATSVCIGSTVNLSETVTGGTWSSSNASVATIDASSGLLGGASSGTARITYTVTTACGTSDTTMLITVNSSPSAGTIAGASSVCQGATISLTDGVSGGTWTSDNTSVATVTATGTVTGVTAGTANITYTVTGSCGTATAAKTVTVNPLPGAGAITGTATVCAGATTTLSDTATGGGWTSSNTLIATVGSTTGVVTGVTGGTATISYIVSNACGSARATQSVTVTALPSAGTISGSRTVCIGSTSNLTDAIGGGTWSSLTTSVATVSASGVVTGVAAGSAVIEYSVSNSCGSSIATDTITASVAPTAGTISGITAICAGSTTTLTDGVSGGTWTSSNTAVATVNATGTVTGVSGGNSTISYTVTGTCGTVTATKLVLVTGLPTAGTITGTLSTCLGSTTTLFDTATGGTWTSGAPTIGTVSAAGVVTGVSAGNVTITYTVTNTCASATATATVAVQVAPATGVITGTTHICAGLSSSLSDTVSGGAWTTSNASVATVNGAGVMTGVSSGTANITYTVTNSCGSLFTTIAVTIDPAISAGTITGTAAVCPGTSTTLTDAVSGGTWSTSSAATATVSATGTVGGVAAGTAVISYAVTNVCGTAYALDTVTVNTMPTAGTISGLSVICTGSSTTLTDAVSGGTWTSGSLAVASVTAGGVVNGVTAGSATITYTVTNVCGTATTTFNVTVNTAPSAGTISGVSTVCPGTTTTLVDGVSGGTWSSSNTTIATVNSSGLVRGIAAGTVNISYIITTSCGTSIAHTTITVTTSTPAGTITGATALCTGSSSTLTDAISGGTWSSSNTAVATVTAGGTVHGIANGTSTISYAVTGACGTSYATDVVTVTSTPSAGAITGASSVCSGSVTALSDTISGGTWTSSNASVATVDASGNVTGVTAGSVTITYSVSFTCGAATTTKAITVNALPVAGSITGTSTVCVASTSTLVDGTSGGTWSSSNTSVATVSATGTVTGVAVGSANINYIVTNGCGSDTATDAVTVITGASAGTITGTPTTFCAGTATTLTDTTSGGTWSSSNPAVATVSATGRVTGVSGGTATITYGVSSSCGIATATMAVTINPLPNTGTITGTPTLCVGGTTSLTDTATGGAWTSSNNTIATVSSTGMVTGVATGTATISYTATNACGTTHATMAVTVTSSPSAGAITGTTAICISSSSTLADAVSGGTWTSSNASVATVDASGNVNGVAAGVATISYSITSSCGTGTAMATVTVTSGVSAGSISGTSTLCQGATLALTDAVSGGTWSSSSASTATVDASGNVYGVGGGSVTISYTVTTSCGTANALKALTVNPLPTVGTIGGGSTMCAGATLSLTDAVTGGTWSSSNTTVATINASGVVTGLSAGSTVISYSATNSCGTAAATDTLTVNGAPSAGFITGTTSICTGTVSSLSDATTGGTWSSSNASVATVDAAGNVSGVAVGSATISYTITNSCGTANATTSVTVGSGTAGSITGTTSVCTGATTTLADAVSGGTWSSSNISIATVSATGVVTGVATGSATITYTVTTSCGSAIVTAGVTVGTSADAGTISGLTFVCTGTTSTLTDAVTGGTWSSSNIAVATVDASGNVSGVSSGTTTISYTVSTGCGTATATATVTVGSTASAGTITGTTSVCAGSTTTLADATLGGSWSSSDATIASISASGVVTGVATGSATITYAISTSCGAASTTTTVTVGAGGSAGTITGATSVCTGSSITLSDATSGGSWSTSSSVATVDASGNVYGLSAGTATITYSLAGGCGAASTTATITVNPMPAVSPISGISTVCTGTSSTLSDATAGGTWSSTNTSVATIDATGNVFAVAAGTATISYSVTNSCGTSAATTVVTVGSGTTSAGTISGTTTLCAGTSSTLTDAVTGGTWSSSTLSVATVDAAGNVYGVSAGTTTISYIVSSTCGSSSTSTTVTVNPAASAGAITGAAGVCVGSTVTLSDAVAGGTWSSSNTSVANITSAGVVTGTGVGVATITYTVAGSSCSGFATYSFVAGSTSLPTLTVTPGSATLCGGAPVTLTTGITTTPLMYQWYRNGAELSGATSYDYTASVSGNYTAVVTNGCAVDTLNNAVVRSAPVPVISVAGANTLTTGSFASYQWYLGGVAISGTNAESYVYSTPGVYTVRVTDVNGCSALSAGHTITSSGGGGSTGVVEVNGPADVNIYPNPATSIVHISASVKVNVMIVTSVGKVVIDQKDASEINMSGIANGLYMIMVYDENNNLLKVTKLVKAE